MFTGCGTALVTPFRRDLSLDEQALRSLVKRQIDAGVDFLSLAARRVRAPRCLVMSICASSKSPLRSRAVAYRFWPAQAATTPAKSLS